jgi:MYXO-CTERM domain-containing protein
MLLTVSMQQTTLYDQINYSGSPASFAWVLPIKGTVTVGLSADILFQIVGNLTATQVETPPTNCPPPPSCAGLFGTPSNNGGGAAEGVGSGTGSGVTVTAQAQVGPYETVQLHSPDGSALNDWLTGHGYAIPASTQPIITSYVTAGFDFLALKLIPGAGVQSMQPVRVTSQGAALSLPLHMVAVGTGPTTGITIWVVADGRYEPKNFPTFTIADSEIAWDWNTSSSNYETVRLAKEATFGGRGWQIESSLELSQYTISQSLLQNVEYGSATGGYLAGPSGDGGAADAASGSGTGAGGDAGGGLAAANADLDVLFAGISPPNVRITRMRSDVAQSALSVDMALQASSDQSEMTNLHTPGQQIGEPQCAIYNSDCEQTGTAPRSQAIAMATSSNGCSTTQPKSRTAPTLAGLMALAGLVLVRSRRRARRSR